MLRREQTLKAISIALTVAMVLTVALNVFGFTLSMSGNAPSATDAVVKSANFKNVDINSDYLREQYIDQELLQKKIASYDGERWVIVEFDDETLYEKFKKNTNYSVFKDYAASAEGKQALESIESKHRKFLSKLAANGIQYDFKYSYATLTNGVAIKVDAPSYNSIRSMSGVEDIYYSESYAVPTVAVENNANVYTTGIYNSKDVKDKYGYQGEGMAVAILDTGLDHTHEAFKANPDVDESELHYTREDIANIIATKDMNAAGTVDDLYLSTKVPFAYDYADDDSEVYPSYESHGTHVAGIVAGQSEYVVNAETGETFVGVAPKAQLVICKVFTDNLEAEGLGGANTMDILAALSDCVLLGVDVINMSLGSSAGFADEKSDAYINDVYNSIRAAGISLICAASNDYSSGFGGGNGTNLASNPDSSTVGSPSTYPAALSVASINGQKSKYITAGDDFDNADNPVAFITNASDGDGNKIEFFDALYEQLDKTDKTQPLRLKYVVIGGVGRNTNYASARRQLEDKTYQGEPVDGTIAMVKRGDITFAEKVQYAMDNGADAVIIYNNVSGTLNMSLGEVENPVPTCLITMDAANAILAQTTRNQGIINVSYKFEAGPFMSDFSSWGPMADLQLKPEITAHGGEITSAVAGGYNIYSGTSMASPNMAGAVALLRQHLKKEMFPEVQDLTPDQAVQLNARVNQQLMSTATIAKNEEDNPYSPRKQGAGLASIMNAIGAEGYLTVDDAAGKERDKTKVELGDDPTKKGVYTFEFDLHNISNESQTYDLGAYVMTETMASDHKTVAEKAYLLNSNCNLTFKVGGNVQNSVTVAQNSTVTVEVTIELKDGAKSYLDSNFENGMYVEGYVTLTNSQAGRVPLNLPYLAFYGDWTDAPLFDYDQYEIAESENDSSVDPEDKLKASGAATTIYGSYYDDRYYLPVGSFPYTQDETAVQVLPDRDKIAVSMYDDEGARTIYELYMVYAGLLRNAGYMNVIIENASTGEILTSELRENVRKGYAAGGANRGAFINLEINPYEWGLQNNDVYNVYLVGALDFNHEDDYVAYDPKYETNPDLYEMSEDGNSFKNIGDPDLEMNKTYYFSYVGHNIKADEDMSFLPAKKENSFAFQFAVDYEDPQIKDCRLRYEPYTEYNQVKYRIYMDIDVYDNQYVMSVLPCHLVYDRSRQNDVLTMMTEYAIPVDGEKNSVTTVSMEVTDLYDDYIRTGQFYVQVEDYAMNNTVIALVPEDASELPEDVTFAYSDSKLTNDGNYGLDENEHSYPRYQLVLQPNELYKLNALVSPATVALDSLQWVMTANSNGCKAAGKGSEIFAGDVAGTATLELRNVISIDEDGKLGTDDPPHVYAEIYVVVSGTPLAEPRPEALSIAPFANGDQWLQGAQGITPEVEMNPNMEVQLKVNVSPWYVSELEFAWTSGNSEVATAVATEDTSIGLLKTLKKGTATITVSAVGYGRMTQSIRLVVGSEFEVNNYYLYNYYGGPVCTIPDNLNVMYIDEDCFKNNTTLEEIYLPGSLQEIPEDAFTGCTNLKKVVIPSSCVTVNNRAFKGCANLQTIVLEGYKDMYHKWVPGYKGIVTFGKEAFMGCTSLESILLVTEDNQDGQSDQGRITTLYDSAFEGCTSLTSIDLSELRVAGKDVFKGCTNLQNVTTSPETKLGENMFEDCEKLTTFTFKGQNLPAGVFKNSGLTSLTFENNNVLSIGSEALYGTEIAELTLPGGTFTIGYDAFANMSNLEKVIVGKTTNLNLVDGSPFTGDTKFTAFELANSGENELANAGENGSYSVTDGVLYNKGQTVVVAVPINKEAFELPTTVTEIGQSAFAGNLHLTSIDLTGKKINPYSFAASTLETVTLPAPQSDGECSIPEGAFAECKNLATVNGLDKVTSVGAAAFINCVRLNKNINLSNATFVGSAAFMSAGSNGFYADRPTLSTVTLTAPKLATVEELAFMNVPIREVNLPAITSLGSYAFAYNFAAESASIGPVTSMGEFAFAADLNLITVSFADGAKLVGNGAFFMDDVLGLFDGDIGRYDEHYYPLSRIVTVTLPNSVEAIGSMAFIGATNLLHINLSGVKTIGTRAFASSGLTNDKENGGELNFENTQVIGAAAFQYSTGIVGTLDLSNVEQIGDVAFQAVNAEAVTFEKLTYLGALAFDGAGLTTVKLPQGFNLRQAEYVWDTYDEKGRTDSTYSRRMPTFAAAFTGNIKLEKIEVEEGNETFFADDHGVLYSRLPDGGYVLEQYPTGAKAESYTVLSGTKKINDYAFAETTGLLFVELPYTVKAIGTAAFLGSSVKSFVFNSVEAPKLLAAYDDSIYYAFYDILGISFYPTRFYNNFFDYEMFADDYYMATTQDYGLTATVPKNGRGYDSPIWKAFFQDEIHLSANNMADDTTHEAFEAVEQMPSAEEIDTMSAQEGFTVVDLEALVKKVHVARVAYNKITAPDQLELATETLQSILAAESKLRQISKDKFNKPVTVASIERSSSPRTRYNVGERFDPTGFALRVVYSDSSEITVQNGDPRLTFDKEVISAGDQSVMATYVDENGTTWTHEIFINVNQSGNPSNPGDPENPDDPGNSDGKGDSKLSGGAIAGIAVGCVVAVLAIVGVVLAMFFMKKKKGGKPAPDSSASEADELDYADENENEQEEANDSENEQEDAQEDENAEQETEVESPVTQNDDDLDEEL